MESPRHDEAERLADAVRPLIKDDHAKLSVFGHDHLDESSVVGTADAFLRLAEAALRGAAGALAGRIAPSAPEGEVVTRDFAIHDLFDTLAEVRITNALVVEADGDRTRLRDYVWGLNNGPSIPTQDAV